MDRTCPSVIGRGVASLSNQAEGIDQPSDKPVHVPLRRGKRAFNKAE
tara:strand:- start:376 stop:516 length:141 start_codon:yes stop_codon:yes gene_type:complete